ncbi:cysteine hydrolase [Bacillus sp. HMF5848]|uniref:cysteine hydrolase family protein n=1 Tax=Bacillus sp. HMF5848 TaxID=2495421 RepID=UPI000F76AC37|nr:isochorismatase family cysteine hydrolase [Bacillus sp. HMF5848]RSK27721.1 cysteine hydrolase [Bacillus sp. HMF5848]
MEKEALLIIDMSHDFVADDGGLTVGKSAQEIVPNIIHLANDFLERGQVVVVCMDAHQPDDAHFELWPPHNVIDTPGQKLYGDLQNWYETHQDNPNVLYIPKPEYDAFFGTDLDEKLKEVNVKKVHLTGVCTDICNFLTAYGAYARGYKTVAHKDSMATFTGQHDTFIEHMKTVFKTEIV